ncbi:HD domain-containing protein [Deinococcus peraridilitoris]|uniref:Putative HD superfamily hydrolase n=1 Tax=Deinococcus peraridilitoris (strain DSM 19664 / LMG 22246 / CIP 109416 / KR-200) TaxID=937777 RepID=L0A4H5_DEIPD|nr:HD domain-containing protein [Deinococcus peraridilitoris]AFZ68077.1 putative HD superfamily hydrolase [Deinococcus peraridilitoris DSM 19664]
MNRDEAYALMMQFTPSVSLQRHMLNVETAMRAYARHWGESEETYAVAGLLHDFDYELHPDEHPNWGVMYLRGNTDTGEDVLDAIMGHASFTGTPRDSLLAKTLFAVDELTGLIQAAALIRPDKDVRQVELTSLKKRFRTRSFAAGVNRDEVEQGARELGVDLDEHMARVLRAMQDAAAQEAGA